MRIGRVVLFVLVLGIAVVCGCGGRTEHGSRQQGAAPVGVDAKLRDAVLDALVDDHVSKAREMIEAHPELVNAVDDGGSHLLFYVLESDDVDLVNLVLDKGARTDVMCPHSGTTPLHWAPSLGSPELVKRLLAAGVDPKVRDDRGETALSWAVRSAGKKTVKVLLETDPLPEDLDRAILRAALRVVPYDHYELNWRPNIFKKPLTPEEKVKVRRDYEAMRRESEEMVTFLRSYRKDPEAPYAFWKAAQGVGPDRMNLYPGKYLTSTVYSTLWKHGAQEHLVRIEYPGCELFGTPYDIVVLDRTPKVVHFGEMTMPQDGFPYALVEVCAETEDHPAGLRGKWTLAVAHLHWEEGWDTCEKALDLTKPRVLVPWYRADDEAAVYVGAKFIEWEEGEKLRYGAGNLADLEDVRFRWAEPGEPVFSNLAQKAGQH